MSAPDDVVIKDGREQLVDEVPVTARVVQRVEHAVAQVDVRVSEHLWSPFGWCESSIVQSRLRSSGDSGISNACDNRAPVRLTLRVQDLRIGGVSRSFALPRNIDRFCFRFPFMKRDLLLVPRNSAYSASSHNLRVRCLDLPFAFRINDLRGFVDAARLDIMTIIEQIDVSTIRETDSRTPDENCS